MVDDVYVAANGFADSFHLQLSNERLQEALTSLANLMQELANKLLVKS